MYFLTPPRPNQRNNCLLTLSQSNRGFRINSMMIADIISTVIIKKGCKDKYNYLDSITFFKLFFINFKS